MKTVKFDEEKFRDYLQENVKGQSYGGMFRNHHAINFNLETGEFWEEWSASDNLVFPNADPCVRVFCNGNEGSFDLHRYAYQMVYEMSDYIKNNYDVPENWDDMDDGEKTKWYIENCPDEAQNDMDVNWDLEEDKMVDEAIEKIKGDVEYYFADEYEVVFASR